MPDALRVLEERGYRLTGPRRLVAGLLAAQGRGLSAEDICGKLPRIGRATIYRTVKLLVEEGIACRVSMPDGGVLYALDEAHQHHHHAVCVRCGLTRDFHHPAAEGMLQTLRDEVGGEIVGHRIELFILCERCGGSSGR